MPVLTSSLYTAIANTWRSKETQWRFLKTNYRGLMSGLKKATITCRMHLHQNLKADLEPRVWPSTWSSHAIAGKVWWTETTLNIAVIDFIQKPLTLSAEGSSVCLNRLDVYQSCWRSSFCSTMAWMEQCSLMGHPQTPSQLLMDWSWGVYCFLSCYHLKSAITAEYNIYVLPILKSSTGCLIKTEC